MNIERKILEVEVISSEKLNEDTLEDVKCILSKKHQDLVLEIKQTIKTEILGGLIIKIGMVTSNYLVIYIYRYLSNKNL
jgi:F0F1-type ATP synthase delta subunit